MSTFFYHQATVKFPSIHIEGSILSPDILDSIEDLRGQSPQDFEFDKQVAIKGEIAQAWADAHDYWRIFQRKIGKLSEGNFATTETRNQWIIPLLGLLRYEIEFRAKGETIDGRSYLISHRVSNRANTPLIIVGVLDPAGLEKKSENARRRMSAHALMQEYLNLRDELYGIVTDGHRLRLLRDSSRLVKQSYLEFDLERIFDDGLFVDFSILFRLIHASRLPKKGEASEQCLLEHYHQDSLESGARIRTGLSAAVKQAILDLGNGFLSTESNEKLRERLEIGGGRLTAGEFYQYLLRLIYRLLFLMVIEERDLVFPQGTPKEKRFVYQEYYSVTRIRRLSEKRSSTDSRKEDLWLALKACFCLFESGGPGNQLGISPLAGNLFSPDALGELADSRISNKVLVSCLNSLGMYHNPDSGQRIRVNYAALNVEEFGSVYEGLLEYEPVIASLENSNTKVIFSLKLGKDRAATGSHYTPDNLVQPLIQHSIDHLIENCRNSNNPESALLDLKVADIACGSGHILLAAARRIAVQLAALRSNEDQPTPKAYRTALRDVICNCIYGVDVNPLAVELCRVAFWLEAHIPGQPLNFLDHRIKCGNAIVGFSHRQDVDNGVPTEAYKALPGDDKSVAAMYRKVNQNDRDNRNQVKISFATDMNEKLDSIMRKIRSVEKLPELTSVEVDTKKKKYATLEQSEEAKLMKTIADIPIAQFYIDKTRRNQSKFVLDSEFRQYWQDRRTPEGQGPNEAIRLGRQKRYFHWFLEFPEVMEQGGFDCIVGNPPYLGGHKLSKTFGYSFSNCMKWIYSPSNTSDLVVYFIRRIFALLKTNGIASIISTNSIIDGVIRNDGLDQILEKGAVINMAVRNKKWPGDANLFVSLLSFHKGDWCGKRFLDGKEVTSINSFFEEDVQSKNANKLQENENLIFRGWDHLGDGFLLSQKEAQRIRTHKPESKDVILPYLNGVSLNRDPDPIPQQCIIYFRDWSLEQAQNYPEPFAIVEERVKPIREHKKSRKHKELWWTFSAPKTELFESLRNLPSCFVSTRTTKYLTFSKVSTSFIFSTGIHIFTTDRWDLFSIVQSTIHEMWARKYSGSLKVDLRYSPSNCFINFPFPLNLFDTPNEELVKIGEHYHNRRKELMQSLNLGLTKFYNLFHSSDLTLEHLADVAKMNRSEVTAELESIKFLRNLHTEMDKAVRDAYGWRDLDLEHGFHEVEFLPENERIRFTISLSARRELLNRLLEENLTRSTPVRLPPV